MDFAFRIRLVDDSEKIKEVLMPVGFLAFPHHFARGNVQCGKERRRAVSFIIVSTTLWMAELQGKKRLSSIERLYLALLVNG